MIAAAILEGFDDRYRSFRETAAEAQELFERADWPAVRAASRARIDLYDERVREVVAAIIARFPGTRTDDSLWPRVKRAYIGLLYDHHQAECAETFYNSVACRVLDRTYYRNEYIFWRPAVSTDFIESERPVYRCFYPAAQGIRGALREIAASLGFRIPFADLARDLRLLIRALPAELRRSNERHPDFHVRVLSSIFYRHTGAYVVGRIINGTETYPFAVSLRHAAGGGALYVDALLLTSAQVGRLFSTARAYFTVDMEVPAAVVRFLHELMPTHTAAELYAAVGLQKQGKTLFYRELQEHLALSTDRFVIAPGVRGLVMVVFTLPSHPYVFKLIRDTFRPPKQTSRAEVRAKYLMVKHHDRAGRMADTLEYSDVALPLARFSPEVLAELESACGSIIERDGDRLVIQHLYIERRMTPLDLFLRDADEDRARRAIEEFGRALRELAQADVFPGDLLSKNFGVTRAGRVVFYDYDEVSALTDVHFRRLPAPRRDEDELSADPWFYVGPQDVFPEEWPTFIFQSERDRALFRSMYPELTDADWWAARQEEIRRGIVTDVWPYPEELRFPVRFQGPG